MAEELERDIELLEIQEMSVWRQQLVAAAAGLFTAGPVGLIASLETFRRLEGQWLPWALIGLLAAPPLAYGQWRGVAALQERLSGETDTSADLAAAQLISESDRIARTSHGRSCKPLHRCHPSSETHETGIGPFGPGSVIPALPKKPHR